MVLKSKITKVLARLLLWLYYPVMNLPKEPNQSVVGLRKAIEIAGGQSALAGLIRLHFENVQQPHIQKWLKSPVGIPPEYCVAIELETAVSRKALRPNDWWRFWPELDSFELVSSLRQLAKSKTTTQEVK